MQILFGEVVTVCRDLKWLVSQTTHIQKRPVIAFLTPHDLVPFVLGADRRILSQVRFCVDNAHLPTTDMDLL
jgi:hypothetical protein